MVGIVVIAGLRGGIEMSVRKDTRNKRWFFRATVKTPDGLKTRIYGTPGMPGPYHDLTNSKVGAQEAERRAIAEAMKPTVALVPKVKPKQKEVPTLRDYSEIFLAQYKPDNKPSAKASLRHIVNRYLLEAFGDCRLDEILQGDIDRFAGAELARKAAVKSVNNRLAALSSLLKYAAENNVIPMPNLRLKLKGTSPEIEAVPMADVDRMLKACKDARYRAAILLAAEAGLRSGEILGLQWGDIKDGTITIRRALDKNTAQVIAPKHNKKRTVPVSPRLAQELEKMPRLGLWVVGRKDGEFLRYEGFNEALRNVYTAAKVNKPSKPIHCLRHTFGSESAKRGMPLSVLAKLMGHADIKTTMRYVQVDEEQMERWMSEVFGVAAARQQRPKTKNTQD